MGMGHIQKRLILAFLYFPTYNKRIQWCSSAVGQYERIAFTNWGGDHPTKGFLSYFEGDCVRLKRKDGWKWHETACFSPHRTYRFVCEYGKSNFSDNRARKLVICSLSNTIMLTECWTLKRALLIILTHNSYLWQINQFLLGMLTYCLIASSLQFVGKMLPSSCFSKLHH